MMPCFSKNAINSLRRNLRLISTFPISFTPWIWKTDLAVSRPIMVTLIAGGSLVAQVLTTALWHIDAVGGPSTPSHRQWGGRAGASAANADQAASHEC